MKEIKLNRKHKSKNAHLKLVALVDDSDFDFLNQFYWHIKKQRGRYYAVRTLHKGRDEKGKQITEKIWLHRFILDAPKGKEVDHKDNNGLNNQRDNLRICTSGENKCNRHKIKIGVSKYLGVSFQPSKPVKYKDTTYQSTQYWRAKIEKNKKYFTKYCKTEIAAALAYNEMAIKIHGEFANLNVISP